MTSLLQWLRPYYREILIMLHLGCICKPGLDETCLKVWKYTFILVWIFCLRHWKELNSLKRAFKEGVGFSHSLLFRLHGIYRGGEWENTQQPYVFWNKNSALGKNTSNLSCMFVWTSSRILCPWDWLPSRGLLTLQGGVCSVWFHIAGDLGGSFSFQPGLCGILLAHPITGNTESAWAGAVLWLRWWWWNAVQFYCCVPLLVTFWLGALRDLPIATWI